MCIIVHVVAPLTTRVFFSSCSRELAESSPYFEALKGKDVEVLYCFDAYDEVLMMQLGKFNE